MVEGFILISKLGKPSGILDITVRQFCSGAINFESKKKRLHVNRK